MLGRGRAATSKRTMLNKWGNAGSAPPRLLLLLESSVIGGMLAVGMTWLVRAVTPMSSCVAAGNLNAAVVGLLFLMPSIFHLCQATA